MKVMCLMVSLLVVGIGASSAQNITFNGCHYLFEAQDYVFSPDGTDAGGRNIYVTTPVSGDQPCGGIGTCEFRISWNTALARWEFHADAGSGDFADPLLIYYNTAASLPDPPSLSLGSWVENAGVTEGSCAGNLSASNAVLAGNVQDTLLEAVDAATGTFAIYPNPARDVLMMPQAGLRDVRIYNDLGQLALQHRGNNAPSLDVSSLARGFYVVCIEAEDGRLMVSKFIKI